MDMLTILASGLTTLRSIGLLIYGRGFFKLFGAAFVIIFSLLQSIFSPPAAAAKRRNKEITAKHMKLACGCEEAARRLISDSMIRPIYYF